MSKSNTDDQFQLSQLLYDTRYRSITIQVIATIVILTFFGWLVSNAVTNLAELGKPIQWGFLFDPAGYDINQRLIEYDSRDPHLRAAVVGLINTLVVAILGCITATILGVLVGVLRLSKNWIVARLMTVYVEIFRNIPVLIWILIVFTIMIDAMPKPALFKKGEASMFMDLVAVTNRGIYAPSPSFENGLGTIRLFGDGGARLDVNLTFIVLAIVFGACLYVSRRIKLRADRIQSETGERPTVWWQRLAVTFIPVIVLLAIFGLTWNIPELKGFNFKGGLHLRNSLIALWLALSLYTSAFIAEAVRGGIQSVSKGQSEAAAALGLPAGRTMSLVILPQALRVIIPPLISQYLNLMKNSSLAIAVGYMDLTGTLAGITLNQTGREMETLLLTMAFYLTVSLLISAAMNVYNERVKLVER